MNNTELLNQLLQLTVWLPIKDYDNYEISICGQVRNSKTKRILKQRINKDGYYIINLYQNSQPTTYTIHRIVATHFIPNLRNDECIDHKNNNRLDNTVSNLRWCNLFENQHNRQLSKNNTSGSKGIYYRKSNNKWEVTIMFQKKQIYLGCFDDINDAKVARQNAAKQLFGEFLNECEK